jgi:HPt (histidine-containing phosphotransfer) domain-containing protein
MDDYLSKPIQVEELIEALERCQPQPTKTLDQPPARPSESPEVLDPGALERLRVTLGSKADQMLPGLIDGFYQDSARLLAQARLSLQQGQAEDLRRAAHSLKSTSATFGAGLLSAAARELEYLARDGQLEDAAAQIERAEAEFARAKAALESLPSAN